MADGGFECARTDVQLGIVFVLVRVFVSKLELVGAGVRAGGGARRLLAVPEVRCGKALFCTGVGVAHAADVALCLVHNSEQPGEHAEAAEGLGGEVGGAGEAGVGEEGEEAVGEVAEEGGEVCGVVLEGVAEVVCADDRGGVLRRGEEGVPLRPVRAVPGGDPLGRREPLDARGGGLELELRVLRLREERQPDRLWQRLEHRVSSGELNRRGRVTARETIGPLLAFLVATITYTPLFFTPLSRHLFPTFTPLHTPTPPAMDFSQFNGAEQAHMSKVIEKKQMQDFMRLYSGLVEKCFNACAQDFTSKALTTNEVRPYLLRYPHANRFRTDHLRPKLYRQVFEAFRKGRREVCRAQRWYVPSPSHPAFSLPG